MLGLAAALVLEGGRAERNRVWAEERREKTEQSKEGHLAVQAE